MWISWQSSQGAIFLSEDHVQWWVAWFWRGRDAEPRVGLARIGVWDAYCRAWWCCQRPTLLSCHSLWAVPCGRQLCALWHLWICAGDWFSFYSVTTTTPSSLLLLREPRGERWEHPHQPWPWYQLWVWVGHCWNTDGEGSGRTGEGTPSTERVKSWCGTGIRTISEGESYPL